MEAPYSRFPALPAAIGLASGVALQATPVAPAVLCGVGVVAAVAALWFWSRDRFFATAPAALLIGMAVALAAAGGTPEPEAPPARAVIADALYLSPMSGPAAAFAATTIVADDTYLTHALRSDFRGSGLAHLLALSGFHVGVVAMIAIWLTTPMMLAGRARHARWAVVLAAVWAFALLGGMRPSLLRASVMCTMLLASRCLGRYNSPLNSLAVAAIVILLLRPSAISDVGFRLSFAAVIGILVFAPALNPFADSRPWLKSLGAAVAVPLSATLTTAPIVAATFGTFPLLFLPANIVASVLFTPFYALALAVAALTASGIPCGFPAWCADTLYGMIAGAASLLNHSCEVRFGAVAAAVCWIMISAVALRLLIKKG